MYKLLLLIIHCGIINAQIDKKVQDYYKSESYLKFKELWQPQRKSFEHIIAQNLQNYIKRNRESLFLSDGVYIDDNVLKVLLYNVRLLHFPRLLFPKVTLALASNEMTVEARLSKMVIPAEYMLFGSNVGTPAQDPYDTSPFSFQQVMHSGIVTIIAERCNLGGHIITKIDGMSVNLGHDTFQVTDCQFTIEITTSNTGAPPIIAPYFGTKNAKIIHQLLSKPIRQELVAVLQASMFTYINTSAIFGSDLPEIRKGQDKIFLETTNYTRGLVKKAVSNTVRKQLVVQSMDSLSIYCNMKHQHRDNIVNVNISKVGVYELDKLYSARVGGPHKLRDAKVGESFRFGTLMIRGRLSNTISNITKTYDFLAEISDVYVSYELNIEDKISQTFNITGWRSIDVSIKSDIYDKYGEIGKSILTGYIGNRLTNLLNLHLSEVFDLLGSDNENSPEKSETEQDGISNGNVLNKKSQSNTLQSSKETKETQKDDDSTKYDSVASQAEQNLNANDDDLNDHNVQSSKENNEDLNGEDMITHDSGVSQIAKDESSNEDDLQDALQSHNSESSKESNKIQKNEDKSSENELNNTQLPLETGEEKNESQNDEDNSQVESDAPRIKVNVLLDNNEDATGSENDEEDNTGEEKNESQNDEDNSQVESDAPRIKVNVLLDNNEDATGSENDEEDNTGEEKNESQNDEDNSQVESDAPRIKVNVLLDNNEDATGSENDEEDDKNDKRR